MIGTVTDTVFTDTNWGTLEIGEYKYGVAAVYEGNVEAPIVWSNSVENDVWTTLDVTVTTNADSSSGTREEFVNTSEPGLGFDFETYLNGSGYYAWDKVRKGTYV